MYYVIYISYLDVFHLHTTVYSFHTIYKSGLSGRDSSKAIRPPFVPAFIRNCKLFTLCVCGEQQFSISISLYLYNIIVRLGTIIRVDSINDPDIWIFEESSFFKYINSRKINDLVHIYVFIQNNRQTYQPFLLNRLFGSITCQTFCF